MVASSIHHAPLRDTRSPGVAVFGVESAVAAALTFCSVIFRRFRYVPKRYEMNAIMTNFDLESAEAHGTRKWEGLSEIDQAIRDNRLMEYRFRKSWADPWGRKLTMFGVFVILAVFVFLAGTSLGLW